MFLNERRPALVGESASLGRSNGDVSLWHSYVPSEHFHFTLSMEKQNCRTAVHEIEVRKGDL